METKFTPGPWEVRFDHPTIPENIAFIRPANDPDALELATVFGCGPDVPTSAERRANARLMAASPGLLDALKGALECMETGVTSVGVIRAAHAAIAKATGEPS